MNAGQHIRVSRRGNPHRLHHHQDKVRHGPRARAQTAAPRGLVGAQPRSSPSPPWGEDTRLVCFPLASVPIVWIALGTRSISVVEEPRLIADPSRLHRRPTLHQELAIWITRNMVGTLGYVCPGRSVRRYVGDHSCRQASQRRTWPTTTRRTRRLRIDLPTDLRTIVAVAATGRCPGRSLWDSTTEPSTPRATGRGPSVRTRSSSGRPGYRSVPCGRRNRCRGQEPPQVPRHVARVGVSALGAGSQATPDDPPQRGRVHARRDLGRPARPRPPTQELSHRFGRGE
jgi:hypothetical protein